nr:uncharacterized protein LOC117281986 [Nicotiana tomentosiformis]
MRFSELARHTIWLVTTERERIRSFIDGLKYGLRFIMTWEIALGAMFDEVVDIARWLEQVRSQEREEREAKRPHGLGGFNRVSFGGQSHHNGGLPYRPAQMTRPVHRVQGSSVTGPSSSYSGSRGLIQSPPPSRNCFECGELGHPTRCGAQEARGRPRGEGRSGGGRLDAMLSLSSQGSLLQTQ